MLKSLVQAIKINPNHVLAYNNLGIIYKEEGRLSEALTSLSNAIKLDPNLKLNHTINWGYTSRYRKGKRNYSYSR